MARIAPMVNPPSTSNILAILGLRALFFVLAGALRRFRYMRVGLSLLLILVGLKMLLAKLYPLPTLVSFTAIVFVLAATIILSILSKPLGEGNSAKP